MPLNGAGFGPVDNSRSTKSLLHALPLNAFAITGGFWGAQQSLNRETSLIHGYEMLEKAGNFHNLRVAGGLEEGAFKGLWFFDSDLYKWLEAVGWELARKPDAELQAMADRVMGWIEVAQMPDGYINTFYQISKPAERWTDLDHGHELYCHGHLIQAAVALQRGIGDGRMMEVTRRLVDHIYDLFGPGKREGTCGHPEIETALVELYRVTGDPRHLELAQLFIDRRGYNRMRGHAGYGSSYLQDHVPVREATEVTGHAVRQVYLNTGATDLYMETGEKALIDAMQTLWQDMTTTKMYITGGLGSRYDGECFGAPYELPADTCYCETCAAIASFMWNWRLLLLTGEGKYADLMERTLYNGVLPSLGLEGKSYLYVNPLQVRGGNYVRSGPVGAGDSEIRRPAWHGCACCPPNVMRLFSSLQHYMATQDNGGIQIHQYADAELDIALSGGRVALTMRTNYPWDGEVTLRVAESTAAQPGTPAHPWTLALRISAWAKNSALHINGEAQTFHLNERGYCEITRTWQAGDTLTLLLPVEPVWTYPNPRIDAVRGCVALERGPLVYCFESHDQQADISLDDVSIVTAEASSSMQAAIPGEGIALRVCATMPVGAWQGELYQQGEYQARDGVREVTLVAIPYYAWGNRGMRGMRVWVPAR